MNNETAEQTQSNEQNTLLSQHNERKKSIYFDNFISKVTNIIQGWQR